MCVLNNGIWQRHVWIVFLYIFSWYYSTNNDAQLFVKLYGRHVEDQQNNNDMLYVGVAETPTAISTLRMRQNDDAFEDMLLRMTWTFIYTLSDEVEQNIVWRSVDLPKADKQRHFAITTSPMFYLLGYHLSIPFSWRRHSKIILTRLKIITYVYRIKLWNKRRIFLQWNLLKCSWHKQCYCIIW